MVDTTSQPVPDYYEILQVSPNADPEIIQAAYRRLVDSWNANRKPGDPSAFERLAVLDEASAVLSDPLKRQQYDLLRKLPTPNGDGEEEPLPTPMNGQQRPASASPESPHTQQPTAGEGATPRRSRVWLAAVALFAVVFILGYGLLISGGKPARDSEKGPTAALVSSSLSADELFVRVSPAVVQVVIKDRHGHTIGTGSGFLVTPTGLIATNHHVVEKAHTVDVFLADKTTLSVLGVAAFDDEADIAIIKVAGLIGVQPLELAGNDLPSVGTKMYAIGNPLGLANTLSDGLVSGHRELDQMTVIQTTAPISPGSSGGPLLGTDGRVVGVTTSGFKGGQNLNFVPISHVSRLLPRCEGEGKLTRFPLVRQSDSLDFIERGRAAARIGDYDKAIKEYDEAIRLDPTNADYYFLRADTWSEKQDYDQAIKDFDEAIRLDPKEAAYYLFRARAWSGKKKYDQAIKDFDEGIRLNPKDATYYCFRAQAWSRLEKYDQAIKDFDEAIRLDPKDAASYYFRAQAWSSKKKYDEAIRDFDEAIRLDPKDAASYFHRGVAWRHKGDYDKEIKDYDQAIRFDPKHAASYRNRGYAWAIKGEYYKAIRDFDEAIRLDPTESEAFRCRGYWQSVWREYDKAIRDFDEAIRLDPTDNDYFRYRGNAWSAKKDFDKAIRDFDEAIRLDPKDGESFGDRGDAWVELGAFDKAIEDFEEAIRLGSDRYFPNSTRALANLLATCPEAKFRDSKRAIQLATAAWERVGSFRGNRSMFLDTLAAAYAEDGQFDEAVRYEIKALEEPNNFPGLTKEFRQRLALYKREIPYRRSP